MSKRATILAVLAAAVAIAVVPTTAAGSGGDAEVVKRGGCTGASTWKLKLGAEDGRIETEFEVDQNRNGERWRVTLRRNGVRFFRGIRTTQPPSGSFEVRRLTSNEPGRDRIVARTRNLRTGELCRAAARF